MTTADPARRQLHQRLIDTLGSDEASTLMALLPQPGDEPASKADVDRLSQRMDEQFLGVDARFVGVDARFLAMDQRFDDLDTAIALRIESSESRLRGDFHQLSAATGLALADLRTELGTSRSDLRTEMGTSRSELRAELGTSRSELRAELATGLADLRVELVNGLAEMNIGLADLRTEMHRSLRINLLITVGFLGTLVSLVGLLTSTS